MQASMCDVAGFGACKSFGWKPVVTQMRQTCKPPCVIFLALALARASDGNLWPLLQSVEQCRAAVESLMMSLCCV
jgi:hypothetical protein